MSLFRFGPHILHRSQVFFVSPLSFAFVNLKPVVPGHVLISPRRSVKRFNDLTQEEVGDLWGTAQRVGKVIENEFMGTSLSLVVQDGPEAGQSVPHVHIHILPRRQGDFTNNDEIYDKMDKVKVDFDNRKPRSFQEMADESSRLRQIFYLEQPVPNELQDE